MSLSRAIRKLWQSTAPRIYSDVEEEFRSTLEAYQEDLIRQGLPEGEARRKARIFETPISYHGRTYEEGKKIGPGDAVEALWVILRARFLGKLYIDAGHEYEHVTADLKAWWPVLKPGGMMFGDDYHLQWIGVVRAVRPSG